MVHEYLEISITEYKDLASGIYLCKLASAWKENDLKDFVIWYRIRLNLKLLQVFYVPWNHGEENILHFLYYVGVLWTGVRYYPTWLFTALPTYY